ncbi:MAG: hypothetical protein DYG83_01915 [Candidatus Brocadia sp. AMX2]|uniref:Rubrerythrin diiron-binding domain-containing protein n=2 Tax=Candidatus Brocadiaceae TaxID=1127830 RepID=A0ABQ0JVL0_9BACT|nr:MAG: hypothetical protein EDM70_02905 [Candidatus Brocadia sp. AMX2]KXK32782.1 MAG: hypothetical protein UZ01_00204 [Candidatus Brocadia sinica]MBC6930962.1 hypothetical protein [Candidatus Brocadia sp.]MBL1167952.1 hypothetical protein [Candidatus Brocadia sp. AMX1]GAN32642.1 hypothetical protein BROSI_A1157 [Candidatus Brocadia sinica JPN1]
MDLYQALDMVAKDERQVQEKYLKLAEQETDPFVKAFFHRIVKDAVRHEKKVYKKYEKILHTVSKKTY